MLSNKPLPKAEAFLQPVAMEGGWIENRHTVRLSIATTLQTIGVRIAFSQPKPNENSLLALWLASEVHRQMPNGFNDVQNRINLASTVGQLSRPNLDRGPNDPLSPADALQFAILHDAADELSADNMESFLKIVFEHVNRYRAVDQWESALLKFIEVDTKAKPPQAKLAGNFAAVPQGTIHYSRLIHGLANSFVELAKHRQQESANSVLATPTDIINAVDLAALALYRDTATLPSAKDASLAAAQGAFSDTQSLPNGTLLRKHLKSTTHRKMRAHCNGPRFD